MCSHRIYHLAWWEVVRSGAKWCEVVWGEIHFDITFYSRGITTYFPVNKQPEYLITYIFATSLLFHNNYRRTIIKRNISVPDTEFNKIIT